MKDIFVWQGVRMEMCIIHPGLIESLTYRTFLLGDDRHIVRFRKLGGEGYYQFLDSTHAGVVVHDDLIGLSEGSKVRSSRGATYRTLRPTLAEFVKASYTKYEYEIPMRDGKRHFTAVYVPKDTERAYAIMLLRTPYSVSPYGVDRYRRSLGPSEAFVPLPDANSLGNFLMPVVTQEAHHVEHSTEYWLAALATGIILLGILLAYLLYVRSPELPGRIASSLGGLSRAVANKYYVDEIYDAAIVRPLVVISDKVLYRGIDATLIDEVGANGSAKAVRSLARSSRVVSGRR